jgi:hypothetical protein
MFYYGINKLPIWGNSGLKSKLIKIITAGTFLYIIIVSFLFSSYVKNIPMVPQYRRYIFAVLLLDLLATVGINYMYQKKKITKKKQNLKTLNKLKLKAYNNQHPQMRNPQMRNPQMRNQPMPPPAHKKPNINDNNIEETDIPIYKSKTK